MQKADARTTGRETLLLAEIGAQLHSPGFSMKRRHWEGVLWATGSRWSNGAQITESVLVPYPGE